MLQETAHELHDVELHRPPSAAVRLLVAEIDVAIVEFNDAGIGDGDLEDIRCQIPDAVMAVADRLTVDVEGCLPQAWIDGVEDPGGLQLLNELCLKDLGHGPYRSKEIET